MEIVKELNLNKNPQGVRNGSLVNAWNIKLSEDGSYLTIDDGLHDVIGDNISGNIVGIIPCNKEFVVLTSNSKIYRFKENEDGDIQSVTEVNSAWTYSGSGIIKGTYSYNINGELIIVIVNNNGDRVPLKTINLNKCSSSDHEDQYTPSPNIPIVHMTLVDRVSGSPIPQGLYYFFIRFKCQDETYTNWFPVGVPQYAVAKRPLNVSNNDNITVYSGNDVPVTDVNNIKFDCPYGFKFRFRVRNNNEYTKAQLGYILQHDNGTFGRKWHEIKLVNSSNNFITEFNLLFDATNPEEEDISSLLENTLGLFDVKTLTSYENRVYVANYKESDYDVEESSLRSYADDIEVKQYISNAQKFLINNGTSGQTSPPQQPEVVGTVVSYDYQINITTVDGNIHKIKVTIPKNTTIINLSNYATDDALSTIRQALREAVIGNNNPQDFRITKLTGNKIEVQDYPGNYYNETDNYYLENRIAGISEKLIYMKIPNTSSLGVTQRVQLCDAAQNDLPCYKFFENERLRQDFDEYQSSFDSNNLVATNADDIDAGYWINGAVENEVQNIGYFNCVCGHYLRCLDFTITKVTENIVDGTVITVNTDTSEDSDPDNRKYNLRIDHSVRTLMPNEVYAFYVHYVRADGSYTNGIQLFNKNVSENITTEEASIGTVDVDDYDISDEMKDFFPNLEGLKNCELYTYSIPQNTIRDFALYKNINNDKLFYTCDGYAASSQGGYPEICKIVPIFRNIRIPSGYIGVFFSYAKVNPLNLYYAYGTAVPEYNYLIKYKAGEVETGVCTYIGSLYDTYRINLSAAKIPGVIAKSNIYLSNTPGKQYDNDKAYDIDINNRSLISTFGLDGGIGIDSFKINFGQNTKDYYYTTGGVVNVRRHDNSIYSNKDDILISLGQILYGDNNSTYIYGEDTNSPLGDEEFNYPSFVCKDKVFMYTSRIFISDNGRKYSVNYRGTIGEGLNNTNSNLIKTAEIIKHSNFNLEALSVKKEPEIVVIATDVSLKEASYLVKPINMSDLLQFPNDFIDKNYKTYVINDVKRANSNSRTAVIRKSNVLSDESLENTWRYFNSTDYKILPRDKGVITNLLGLGYYFLIHTEHTLYSIDRSNLLKGDTANVQVETPSTFDVEPKEMFTSSHGYGGLQTDSWTANHNGYFFFDRDSVELYNVDNNGLVAMTNPIKKLLSKFNPTDAAFVTDFDNNRVLMCFKNSSNYLTISYNMITKSFISLHSFVFDYGYNTKNRPYIRLNSSNKLGTTNTVGNIIYKNYSHWSNIANAGGLLKVNANTYSDGVIPSIIEVIFNPLFEDVKVLNYISWMIKLISDWNNSLESNMVEEEDYSKNGEEVTSLNRKDWYSGEVLRIYSDLTDSLDLNIETPDDVNQFNNYKYPYFDRGAWNLNYFRNHYNGVNSTPVIAGKSISDNRGLIYGRYFVLRFVIGLQSKYNIPFRLNNVDININKQ